MAANWLRCQTCRKVLPAEDFDGESMVCRVDVAKAAAPAATSRTKATPVTTRTVAAKAAGAAMAVRDIRGRGDHEVRARRARGRALDRLAQMHAEDFAHLLQEERVSEGL